jgi:hypothetical protein
MGLLLAMDSRYTRRWGTGNYNLGDDRKVFDRSDCGGNDHIPEALLYRYLGIDRDSVSMASIESTNPC